MEPNKLTLKLSYIVLSTDKSRSDIDRSYLKILLDENNQIISKTFDSLLIYEEHLLELEKLHTKYVNYDYNYVLKTLCGFRSLGNNVCEVCYITNVNHMPDFYKAGNLYTLEEIQDRNILLEEYHGEFFGKFGTKSFR